jgi:hypothetical protein
MAAARKRELLVGRSMTNWPRGLCSRDRHFRSDTGFDSPKPGNAEQAYRIVVALGIAKFSAATTESDPQIIASLRRSSSRRQNP